MKKHIMDEKTKENEWFDINKELPPYDAYYEVTNNCLEMKDLGVCEYNGYGFIYDGVYKYPKFWRFFKLVEKKYGRQVN